MLKIKYGEITQVFKKCFLCSLSFPFYSLNNTYHYLKLAFIPLFKTKV